MMGKPWTRRKFLSVSAMTAACLAVDRDALHAAGDGSVDKSKQPVVVVGAGLGGLTSAAFLARAGFPVTVLEQRDKPGGYATSFERGDFRFEVSLHETAIGNNAVSRILTRLDILDKLDLVMLPHLYTTTVNGEPFSAPQKDPQAYIAQMSRRFPGQAGGIKKFVEFVLSVNREADAISRENPTVDGMFYKFLFPFRYRKLWHVRGKTLLDLLEEHISDPACRQALVPRWLFYGLPPEKLSGFFYALAAGDFLENGAWYIKPRSDALSQALADAVVQAGGTIRYNTPAKKILVENDAVMGVQISKETLPARFVVAGANAPEVLFDMLPADTLSRRYAKKVRGYEASPGTFVVWLGLVGDIREKVKGAEILVPSGLSWEQDYAAMKAGDVERGSFGITVYDNIFSGYSKPGTSTVTLMCMSGYEPWQHLEAEYRRGEKAAYRLQKEQWAKTLIRRAEEAAIPGLSRTVRVAEAATPLTNLRYTGNPFGAVYGFDQTLDNSFDKRLQNKTPIRGLYLSNAWSNPGGGYGGVLAGGEWSYINIMQEVGKNA